MERTREQWMERARRHQEYVEGLQDGSIGSNAIVVTGMSVEQAIAVELRNVAYCLKTAEGK